MPQLRLALAQVNPRVGDLAGQRRAASSTLDPARPRRPARTSSRSPRWSLTGYPVEDLALRPSFQDASRARARRARDAARRRGPRRARRRRRLPRPASRTDADALGRAARRDRRTPRRCSPAAASSARYAKHHLPNYGVFDEYRYFVPGAGTVVVRVARRRRRARHLRGPLAGRRPGRRRCATRAPGSSSSSTGRRTSATRTTSASSCAPAGPREAGCALAYVNMVGGQDELVFDGDSLVVDADGGELARARRSSTRRCSSSTSTCRWPTPPRAAPSPRCGFPVPAYDALAADGRRAAVRRRGGVARARRSGLRDYVAQERLPLRASLGLSGGIDSARGRRDRRRRRSAPSNVHGVSLPSAYSSEHSQGRRRRHGRAHRAAPPHRADRADGRRVPVAARARPGSPRRTCRRGSAASPSWASPTRRATSCSRPATRASSRSATPRSTATPSAASRRSRTCPKIDVWRLARWRNDEAERRGETPPIPPNSIEKPPSAELRPGQLDTDSLPDYARARRPARRLRRERPRRRRARRGRLRPRTRRARPAAHRRRRVQAPPVPAGHEDLGQGLRPRPSAAHHEPLARDRRLSLSRGGTASVRRRGPGGTPAATWPSRTASSSASSGATACDTVAHGGPRHRDGDGRRGGPQVARPAAAATRPGSSGRRRGDRLRGGEEHPVGDAGWPGPRSRRAPGRGRSGRC